MNFTYYDGTLVVDAEATGYLFPEETTLVANTPNTWQPDRDTKEIERNTSQGKMAEKIIEKFFSEFSDDFTCVTYDQIRQDGFKNSAPFDEILMKKNVKKILYQDCISLIQQDVSSNKYGKIEPRTRRLCRANQIYLVEVKSSKIDEKLMRGAGDPADPKNFQESLASLIRQKRTVWIYPRYCRNSNDIKNYDDYARYVFRQEDKFKKYDFEYFKEKALPILECDAASDIRIQVFVEYGNGGQATRFYVMGYANCREIATNKTISKFPGEKSGSALYMTLPLDKSHKITDLFHDSRLWG